MAARSRTPFVLVEPKRSRQLPPELVALILSYAASTGNPSVGDDYTNDARPPMSIRCGKQSQPILCTSSLVSKLWNHIAMELLYDSVYLSSPRSLSLLSATLCRRKELRTLVHRFVYAPPKDVGAGAGAGTMPFSSWRDLHRIHSMCPHLEARTIKQSDTRTKRYGRLLLRKRFLHYTHPLNTGNVNVQSLTKLEIESIRQAPDTYIPETLVLPQLQDLTLKGFNTRHFFMSFMTYPTMPQLIRLRLKNCSFYGVTIDMALPKNCPRLRIFEVVGGSYFQRFWASFERMVKETHWHIESFTFMPAMTLGSGRPLANNLNYWLPEAYEMHIKADCFLWETNPIEQTLNIPNKVRHLVVEATAKVNYANVQVPWITSILNGVQWILENKRSYVLDLESITIWAWLDKNSRDRHGELVKIGEREGVQIKMFDKSEEILMTVNVNGSDDFIIAPRTSTRLSRTVHRLSPIF